MRKYEGVGLARNLPKSHKEHSVKDETEIRVLLQLLGAHDGLPIPAYVDWNRVLDLALFHGVFPLAHRRHPKWPAQIPREFLWNLTAHVMQNEARCRLLKDDWLQILHGFHRLSLPVIPVKGLWLAEAAYGDISLRAFTDLDFFVREKDLDQYKAVLRSAGYACQTDLSDYYQEKARKNQYELGFFRDIGKHSELLVELQYSFAPRFLSLNIKEVWDRAEPIILHGVPAFRMSVEDTLIYLCIHSWKHGWSRLKWICDIAEFIRTSAKGDSSMAPIRWEIVIERSRKSRIERIIQDSLLLARELLGADIPDSVIRDLGKGKAHAMAPLLPADFPDKLHEIRHWWRYRPDWRDRMKMLASFARPTEMDFQAVPLPQSLFFVYYLLRPFLLMRKLVWILVRSRSRAVSAPASVFASPNSRDPV